MPARRSAQLERIVRQETRKEEGLDWLFEIEAKAAAKHIPTGELRLLLANAERNNFGDRPHAKAYRAELELRKAVDGASCINCGQALDTKTPCFGHCTRCIPPAFAANIHTEADLKDYQRAQGADV